MALQEISRPDVFFRRLHHGSSKGRVVLERKFAQGKRRHSQVTADDAEKIARLSYKVPDLSFSVASFSGMPLLTNFESTSCLHVQLPCSDGVRRNLYNLVEDQGFALPTVVVTDSTRVTFYWELSRAIEKAGFYKVYLMQHGLQQLVKDLHPFQDNVNIGALVPLVGTTDSRTQGYVMPISHTGKILDNRFAENYLMRSFGIDEFGRLKKHSRAILEMLALLHDRVLLWEGDGSVKDWLIFFGASLCNFCSSEQLLKELQALAVSLEGKVWSEIKDEYGGLVERLAETAIQGYIVYEGNYISIDKEDWFNLVSGKLGVSGDEIRRLGLNVLAGEEDEVAPRCDVERVLPVGELSFIPVERLFVKAVA